MFHPLQRFVVRSLEGLRVRQGLCWLYTGSVLFEGKERLPDVIDTFSKVRQGDFDGRFGLLVIVFHRLALRREEFPKVRQVLTDFGKAVLDGPAVEGKMDFLPTGEGPQFL